MVRLSALLSAALVGLSAAITEEELAYFGWSGTGLVMSKPEADRAAQANVNKVNVGRLSLDQLRALKDMMLGLKMPMEDIHREFFPAAEAGVDPQVLWHMFDALHTDSGFVIGKESGCGMAREEAQKAALKLARVPGNPKDVGAIWKTLVSPSKDPWGPLFGSANANLRKEEANQWIVDLVAAGAEPKTLQSAFEANFKYAGARAALKKAALTAVSAGAGFLQARYAKNGKLYSPNDFESYYGDDWLVEWLAAPLEKRVANDGKEYTAQQFQAFYGQDSAWRWGVAAEGLQRRMAEDGNTYTLPEFINYYPANWQTKFLQAPIVADDCAGLSEEGCGAKPQLCQWKWTGDWTESCVVRSSMSAFLV